MNSKSPTSEEEVLSSLLHLYVAVNSASCTKILATTVQKEFSNHLSRFFFSKSPPRLKAPLSWHCIVGHRDTNIRRRTDSIQQVEPIAFEHWKVKRQIVATVDWPHAKWNGSYVRTDTNATDLWEIEQSTLWNSAFQRIPQLFGFGNGFKVATAKHRWYVA